MRQAASSSLICLAVIKLPGFGRMLMYAVCLDFLPCAFAASTSTASIACSYASSSSGSGSATTAASFCAFLRISGERSSASSTKRPSCPACRSQRVQRAWHARSPRAGVHLEWMDHGHLLRLDVVFCHHRPPALRARPMERGQPASGNDGSAQLRRWEA